MFISVNILFPLEVVPRWPCLSLLFKFNENGWIEGYCYSHMYKVKEVDSTIQSNIEGLKKKNVSNWGKYNIYLLW